MLAQPHLSPLRGSTTSKSCRLKRAGCGGWWDERALRLGGERHQRQSEGEDQSRGDDRHQKLGPVGPRRPPASITACRFCFVPGHFGLRPPTYRTPQTPQKLQAGRNRPACGRQHYFEAIWKSGWLCSMCSAIHNSCTSFGTEERVASSFSFSPSLSTQ